MADPLLQVSPGYLGTGQTLQPTAVQVDTSLLGLTPTLQITGAPEIIDTQDELNQLVSAIYLYQTAQRANEIRTGTWSDIWGNLFPVISVDTKSSSFLSLQESFKPIFEKYGVPNTIGPLYSKDPLYKSDVWYDYIPLIKQVLNVPSNVNYFEYGVLHPVFERNVHTDSYGAFAERYGLTGGNFQRYYSDLVSGENFRTQGGGNASSVWDRVFSTPFVTTFVENPISAIQHLVNVFSNSPADNLTQLSKAAVGDVPKVDFTKKGIESGINVVADIGFAVGLNNITTAYSAFSGANLAPGAAGPVAPGFFELVGQGSFRAAFQSIANPLTAALGAPVGFLARTGATILAQEAVKVFIKATGDVGRGILSLISLDLIAAGQSFGVIPTPVPRPSLNNANLFGGGGGGGGVDRYGDGSVQQEASLIVRALPIMILLGSLLLFVYLYRRKR